MEHVFTLPGDTIADFTLFLLDSFLIRKFASPQNITVIVDNWPAVETTINFIVLNLCFKAH